MALYSNKIKTHILDAVSYNDKRAEYRLPANKVLMGNMRLVDLTAQSANDDDYFRHSVGVFGLIKNIYLYDDNVLLDRMINVKDVMMFKNNLSTNDKQVSVQDLLHLTTIGGVNLSVNSLQHSVQSDRVKLMSDINDSSTAWISLGHMLGFFTQPFVSTGLHKNLKLVIEYNKFNDVSLTANDGTTASSINKLQHAQIVFDEVIGDEAEQIQQELQSSVIQYKRYESDSVSISAVAGADTKQSTNNRLKAFDGKILNRVAVLTKVGEYSQPGYAEKFNLIVNGRQLIPYEGIDNASKKLQYLTDAWGNVSTRYGADLIAPNDIGTLEETKFQLDKKSFIGVKVDKLIEDLQLKYERTSTTTLKDAVKLVVIGEVNVAIQYKGDKYVVSYV